MSNLDLIILIVYLALVAFVHLPATAFTLMIAFIIMLAVRLFGGGHPWTITRNP